MGATRAEDDLRSSRADGDPGALTWETPRVVRLNALPEILGACVNGGTHTQGPFGGCRNGTSPQLAYVCLQGYGVRTWP